MLVAVDSAGNLPTAATGQFGWRGWNAHGGAGSTQGFAANRLTNEGAPDIAYFRNRLYDQHTGRWTQEDPLAVAGGLNLYQFNGNNPVSYSDPFGLCAEGDDPPDQITVTVCASADGGKTWQEREVTATRVKDQGSLGKISQDADHLTGGTADYPASQVANQYHRTTANGAIYVYDTKTSDGAIIGTGAVAIGQSVAFRRDNFSTLSNGSRFLNRRANPMFRETVCQVLGHEGVHLVQHSRGSTNSERNENEALAITWGCK